MYQKIDHIAIAVQSLEGALKIYQRGFGFRVSRVEDIADQRTRVAILPIGDSRLELLEPMDGDSPVAKFIAGRGEGLHHVCFQVENVIEELARLKAAGARLIDEIPRRGAGQCLIAFVHPSSTGGVLVELSQPIMDNTTSFSH